MTFVVRKKMLGLFAIFLVVVFSFGFFVSQTVEVDVVNPVGITVVIDAGHGGLDGGSVGANGINVLENDKKGYCGTFIEE